MSAIPVFVPVAPNPLATTCGTFVPDRLEPLLGRNAQQELANDFVTSAHCRVQVALTLES